MRRFLLVIVLFLVAGVAPFAQDDEPEVEARVDAEKIGEGDSLNLTIEIRGRATGHVDEPDLSGLADFTIAAGPSVSTSTSMVWRGGQATSTTTRQFTYALLPRRQGTLTIPTISIRVGKRMRTTSPISVEVVDGRLRSSRPPGRRRPLTGLGPRGDARTTEIEGDVFVETLVDKERAYVGEQILVTYKVLTQVELAELPGTRDLPSYKGFWVEELPFNPRKTLRRVERNGEPYYEITVMKKALFPTASGKLDIETTTFEIPVKAKSRDPFDSIFFTPARMIYRKTEPILIDVKPLPSRGRPDSFNGAVGSYDLSVSSDRRETGLNEAVGLTVTVEGTGNIRMVGEAVLPPLPDYKTYEPRVEESRDVEGSLMGGSRKWDYVLTPLSPGVHEIPPVRFSYFDPAAEAYVEKASEPISIRVARGEGSAEDTRPGMRREVTAVSRDVRYIKQVTDLSPRSAPFHRSGTFVFLLAAPLVFNAGLVLFVRRRDHLQANAALVRRRRAPGYARRRLRKARQLLDKGEPVEFHEEVGRALVSYLGDKLGESPSGLTHEAIGKILGERGVETDLRAELQRCLESCDYARFAPAAAGREEMRGVIETAEGLIERLERHIGRKIRRPSRGRVHLVILTLLVTVASATEARQEDALHLFTEGNRLYAEGDFTAAARSYRQLLNQGYQTEALHYNLGNALYKSGQLGPAILEFERALRLAPTDPDTLANLEFLQSMTTDKSSPQGDGGPTIVVDNLFQITSSTQDAIIFSLLYYLGAGLLSARILVGSPSVRRGLGWGLVVVAVPLLLSGTVMVAKLYQEASLVQAIILDETVDVRSGPGDDNTTLFSVHEGLKVRVRKDQGTWSQISLESGLNGWVPVKVLGVI